MRINKSLPLCLVGALSLSVASMTVSAEDLIAPDTPTGEPTPPTVVDSGTGAPDDGGGITDGGIIDTPAPPTTDDGTNGGAPGGDDMAGGPDTGGPDTGGNGIAVSEPSSLLLMSSALGLLWLRRRNGK